VASTGVPKFGLPEWSVRAVSVAELPWLILRADARAQQIIRSKLPTP
jgi:hypothetical protein